jgi:aminopeptidase N
VLDTVAEEPGRGSISEVMSYDLAVDLTGGPDSFSSRAEVRFRCLRAGGGAFADLHAISIRRAVLNGADLDLAAAYQPGRLELPQLALDNTLVVEADFGYTPDDAGLHHLTGPDGSTCVCSKTVPAGAPRIYCCFDQADLPAPFTLAVNAPAGWICRANAPIASQPGTGEAGLWKFAPTHPIAAYLSSFCAGPFSGPAFGCERAGRDPLPMTVSAMPSATAALEAVADVDLFRHPLRYYEHNLGTPYPYDKCDFVFAPGYPGLAFGPPGLITIKDQVITEPQQGKPGLFLAIVIAHELAHAWVGGLIQFLPDDGWLEEAIASYVSRSALEELFPDVTPWSAGTSILLPDHAYAKDAAKLKQLDTMIGQPAVMQGLGDLLRRHTNAIVSQDDLVRAWSRASGQDLGAWARDQLRPEPSAED